MAAGFRGAERDARDIPHSAIRIPHSAQGGKAQGVRQTASQETCPIPTEPTAFRGGGQLVRAVASGTFPGYPLRSQKPQSSEGGLGLRILDL